MTPRIAKNTRKPLKKIAVGKVAVTQAAPTFERGQKWKLELGHAEVVHVGKVLIDYRYYRVETQRHVPVETKTLVDFADTLKRNKAKLVA